MTDEKHTEKQDSKPLPMLAETEKDLFDTTAATVLVKKVRCPIDEKLREAIGVGAAGHFEVNIAQRCEQIQEVLRVIQLHIDQ